MGVPVKSKPNKKNKGSKAASQVPQMSAEDHFEEAEMAYISDDLESARASYKRALDMEPNNIEFLDGYGTFLAECGPRQEAVTVLQRACELAPNHGFEKFMYLGQVLDSVGSSVDAEAPMRKGIDILRSELAEAGDHPELAVTAGDEAALECAESREHVKEALSSALCSLSELLMGIAVEAADDADEDEDEKDAALQASPALVECDALLEEARQLWPRSPEPLQALCSLRKLQGRGEEALEALRQSLALWYKAESESDEEEEEGAEGATAAATAAAAVNGKKGKGAAHPEEEEDNEEDDMEEDEAAMPSYEFRFECARLLLELEANTTTAAAVLEGLLEENDSVPDVWLLLAVAYREAGELEAAAEAASDGAKVARTLGMQADQEVAAALDELSEVLGKMVVNGPEEAEEEDAGKLEGALNESKK